MQREVAAPPAAATPTATARPSGGKNHGNSEDIAQLQKENPDLAASPNHAKVDKQGPANDLPKSPGGGGGGGASAGGGGGLHEHRTDTPPRLSSLVVIRNFMCSVVAAIRNDAAEFFAYARRAMVLQPLPAQSRMLIAVLLFYIAYRELLRLRRRR